jgi:hypothetical protein
MAQHSVGPQRVGRGAGASSILGGQDFSGSRYRLNGIDETPNAVMEDLVRAAVVRSVGGSGGWSLECPAGVALASGFRTNRPRPDGWLAASETDMVRGACGPACGVDFTTPTRLVPRPPESPTRASYARNLPTILPVIGPPLSQLSQTSSDVGTPRFPRWPAHHPLSPTWCRGVRVGRFPHRVPSMRSPCCAVDETATTASAS